MCFLLYFNFEIRDGAKRPKIVFSKELKKSLGRVALVAASDDSRPVLMGVKVDIDSDWITLAAADGFRLAVDKIALSGNENPSSSAIVPGKTMLEIERLIDDSSQSTIQVSITD